jgi:hypothetical protein
MNQDGGARKIDLELEFDPQSKAKQDLPAIEGFEKL